MTWRVPPADFSFFPLAHFFSAPFYGRRDLRHVLKVPFYRPPGSPRARARLFADHYAFYFAARPLPPTDTPPPPPSTFPRRLLKVRDAYARYAYTLTRDRVCGTDGTRQFRLNASTLETRTSSFARPRERARANFDKFTQIP